MDKEAAEAAEGAGEDEDEGMGRTSTTRSFVCEQQRLRVPATNAASTKLKDFHDQIVELSECYTSSNTSCMLFLVMIPHPSALQCNRGCQGTKSCRAGAEILLRDVLQGHG